MAEKKELRNIYKTKRNGMSRHDVDALSAQICANLTGSDLFRRAQYLYAYDSLGNEADVRPVVRAAWQEGKKVAFPKVFGEEMSFFEVTDFGQLTEGTFGILEPADGCRPVNWLAEGTGPDERIRGSDLLVLVPGVAFDRQGRRLGHGRGYYDRYFADMIEKQGITLIGAAFGSLLAERLPAEPHDLILPYLVTENGIFRTDN